MALELPLATQSGAIYRITEMELTYDGRKDEGSRKRTIAKERENVRNLRARRSSRSVLEDYLIVMFVFLTLLFEGPHI